MLVFEMKKASTILHIMSKIKNIKNILKPKTKAYITESKAVANEDYETCK